MKKFLGLLIVLLIAGGAGAYFFWYQPLSPQATPTQILPRGTLATMEVRDLKQTIEDFRNGPLGQAIKGIDIREAGHQLGADPEEVEKLIAIRDQFVQSVESPWFDDFFGREVLVGVLPLEIDSGEKPSAELFQRALVIITRPKQPADLLDTLGKMFVKDLDITTETLDGHTINRAVASEGPPIFYAVAHGLAVMGLDPDPILRCLSQDLRNPAGLTSAASYQAVEKALAADPSDRFKFYLNLAAGFNWLGEAAPHLGTEDKDLEDLRKGLQYVAGLEALGAAGSVSDENMIIQKMRLLYDPQTVHPIVANALQSSPESNPTLAMVPTEPIYYSWQNTNDLGRIWEALKSNEDFKAEDREALQNGFQQFTGVALEEAVAAVGSQTAWVLNDLITGGFFPIPELALIIQARDPEVIGQILSSLAGKIGVPLSTEPHGESTLTFAQTPLGEDLSPAYLCSDGYCTIATNVRLLKRISTPSPGAGLNDNPKFKALGQGLDGKVNQVAFIDLQLGVAKAKDVLKWSASMAAMTNQEDGPKITYALDNIVNPLLDGLAQYPALAQKAVREDQFISVDLYLQTPAVGE